jgi:PAS domain-containing protein
MKALAESSPVDAAEDWTRQPFVRGLMASASPCAIVDSSGIITRANPAFTALVRDSEGRWIHTLFLRSAAEEDKLVARTRPTEVLYFDANEMLVPASLHTLYESLSTGERLLLLADGGPLRRASEKQLDAAPLAVMRVCAEGVVRFANAETYRALSLAPEDVIGRTLVSMFSKSGMKTIEEDERFTQRLRACFRECLDTLTPVTLDIWVGDHTNNERETARMRMIPDISPAGRALGVTAALEMTLEDRVRSAIGKIARDSSTNWRERLGLVLKQVRRLIKFRHANFGMYANDVRLFRAFAVYPSDKFLWKERWLVLPEPMKKWAMGGATFISDMDEFLKEYPDFAEGEVVRMYREQGIRSSVTLVAQDDHGPTSALSLCSRKAGRYSQRDVEMLRNLNLEPVLIRIEEQIVQQRIAVARQLSEQLSAGVDLPKVVRNSVKQLASAFQWDYASLYRVDRLNKKFELYYQNDCPVGFPVKIGYRQGLDDGMLGQSLRRGAELDALRNREDSVDPPPKSQETLVVNDIGNPAVEQYDYIGLERPVVRSAMTIPLRLNGRIRWMFHIESHEAQAFHGPDLDSIIKVVTLLEEGLMQRAILEFNREIMDETRQGVVMVGLEGAILGLNLAASRLLGLKHGRKPTREFLHEYASESDPVSEEVLKSYGSTEKRRVELQDEDGQIHPVLATLRTLEGSFDTAIWFLIDLQAREWEVGMRFLRATVGDVAQQTRAPLALASNIARQLTQLCGTVPSPDGSGTEPNADAQALHKRLAAELNKADITFERLAKSYDIRRYPARKPFLVAVDLLEVAAEVIGAMPRRDRGVIKCRGTLNTCFVLGDRDRLEFVIRSLTAHMLRMRADEQDVLVSSVLEDRLVNLRFGLSDPQPIPAPADGERTHDVMWRAFRVAREDACLGLAAIKRVVKAHGGSMETEATAWADDNAAPPWIAFHLTLPETKGDARL